MNTTNPATTINASRIYQGLNPGVAVWGVCATDTVGAAVSVSVGVGGGVVTVGVSTAATMMV